jgi:hypothetical protein
VIARLLALGAAAALAVALMPATAIAAPAQPATVAASGDWTQFHNGPTHQGYNTAEHVLSPSNVGALGAAWTATTGYSIDSSPAVANGVVYVGSGDYKLYAYAVGCASGGGTCSPLWTALTGDAIYSSPAVADGVVYVGSADDKLYAFDSAGVVGCSGSPKTCTPLWTASTGSAIESSPAVANGVVYVGSADDKLYAYGVGCASGGGSCTPLWTGSTGGGIFSSPAVANGVVYVGSEDHKLYAFAIIGATYFTVAPARVLDSRPGGGHIGAATFHSRTKQTFAVATVASGVPTDAIAVTGNVTVVGQTRAGFVTVAPSLTSGVMPLTSTINFPLADTRANGITVALHAGGTLDAMYWSSSTPDKVDILFDVTGYFRVDPSGATYFTVAPARVLDSRPGGGHIGAATFHSRTKQTFAVATVASGVPTDAIAVTGNVTVVGQTRAGFVTVAPSLTSGVMPLTSTINFPLADTRANGITVALHAGGTLDAMYWSSSTPDKVDILFDVTGYFRN